MHLSLLLTNMFKKPEPWSYGRSPNPTNWADTAKILDEINKGKSKPKKSGLMDRLDILEKLIREKK
jgi:hypothetical protein